MNKRTLFLCMLGIFISTLCASPLKTLQMGTGNDWYTLGLGNNLDDGLSFGGHIWATTENDFAIRLDLLGYTDRLDSQLRYDELNLTASYPITFDASPLTFLLIPQTGFTLEGNLGFESIQNSYHRLVDRDQVHLTYDEQTVDAHLLLGATVLGSIPFSWGSLGLEASYRHTFAWEGKTQALVSFSLDNALTIKGGYALMTGYEEGTAHLEMLSRLSGPTFAYTFNSGLFFNSWEYHKNSGSSYGIFGVDVMELFQEKKFKSKDFSYSMGFLYDGQGQQNRSFSLTNDEFVLEIRHKNGPLFNAMDEQEKRMTVASWMVGYHRELYASEMIHPYFKIMGGLERFNLEINYITEVEGTLPVLGIEAGVQLGKSGLWVTGYDSYRPRVTASAQYVFGTDSLHNTDDDFSVHTGPWILMLGIGLDIEHDSSSTN